MSGASPPSVSGSAPLRLAVLGSGKGSNFVALQHAIAAGHLQASIQVVVSDCAAAGILERARAYGYPAVALPPSKYRTRLEPEIETDLASLLQTYGTEWVVLAGYMRVVKAPLLRAFSNRILNIHPSLLPRYKGLAAWQQAIADGATVSGCTVHLVNDEVDGGRILGQTAVPVLAGDTAETLHARIQVEEHRLLPAVLQKIFTGDLVIDAPAPGQSEPLLPDT